MQLLFQKKNGSGKVLLLDRAVFESERLFQSRNVKVKILTCLFISDTTSVDLTVFLLAIYFVTLANTTSLVVII